MFGLAGRGARRSAPAVVGLACAALLAAEGSAPRAGRVQEHQPLPREEHPAARISTVSGPRLGAAFGAKAPRFATRLERELRPASSWLPAPQHLDLAAATDSTAYERLLRPAADVAWDGLRDAVRDTLVEEWGLDALFERGQARQPDLAARPERPARFTRGAFVWDGERGATRWSLAARADGVVKLELQHARSWALRVRHDTLEREVRISLRSRF